MNNNIKQPEGNYYNKYKTKNPIAAFLMKNFFNSLDNLLDHIPHIPSSIIEAGCGEGHIISHIYQKFSKNNCDIQYDAFDISENVINNAQLDYPNINFSVGDIYNISNNKYDLVIASEVLEHLEEPSLVYKKLLDISKKYIFISVPNEPLWRFLNMLRGSYLSSLGNTPGHIQHWGGETFKKFLFNENVNIIASSKPIPWQMYLIEKNE